MSRRNLRKLQARETKPVESESEDDESPPQPFLVKKNKFVVQAAEESDSDEQSENLQTETQAVVRPQPQEEVRKEEEEDLTVILERFGVANAPQTDTSESRYESVLKKQAKHFNSDWEISKKFRTSSVQSRAHSTRAMRRTILTPTVLNWPPSLDCALDMDLVSPGAQPVFSFQTSKGYQKLQGDYQQCVETNDPNSVLLFLRTNPFHVEALFQACLFYLLQSNYEQTDVLLQRLLYAFQLSFHHQFSVISPDVRLSYDSSLYNKLWLQSLFMQVDILGRKGCSRTALEFAKLLLSLSPDTDPLGSLFLVEYFSLRCKKYDYFLHLVRNFCREVHGSGDLVWMPDFMFSLAYVKMQQSTNADKSVVVDGALIAEMKLVEDTAGLFSADFRLVLLFAVSLYPAFAQSLLQKLAKPLSVSLPTRDSPIGDIGKVSEIYAERCSDLWKPEPIANWLKSTCELSAQVQETEVERWKERVNLPFRADRYAGLDKMRFSDTVHTAIPQELLAAGGGMQRRMRPRGNLNSYMHPVLLFFATFLPWNSVDFGPE